MYLAIDIGGTKTLVACFDDEGNIVEKVKFPTPRNYEDFLQILKSNISRLGVADFRAAGLAAPAMINHDQGSIVSGGNITWHGEAIQKDIEMIVNAPVSLENDAKLAGLSEAILIKDEFKRVLYVTISTGIGTALIINGVIEPSMRDMEGGHMMLEHKGKLQTWESFASGKAIFNKYKKFASDIDDIVIWKEIVRNFAVGFIDLIAVVQPEVIIVGGGVGSHFNKYGKLLSMELKKYETPIVAIPPLRGAQHAEEAVIYGCYELLKAKTHDKV